MKAIILAAGIGSRLGLEDIPKPMYKIQGKPILEHNILLLKKHGIKDIFINLYYMGDVIKNYFRDGSNWQANIRYSPEDELLGTSGAVKNLEAFWNDEPFFVVYGDNYSDVDLTKMLAFHRFNKVPVTVALFNPEETTSSQVAGGFVTIDGNNKIMSFQEGIKNHDNGYVNAGVYIIEPVILDMIPKDKPSDFGKDIFPELIKKKIQLKGFITKGFVLAIDTKDALKTTEKILKEM